MEMNPDLTIEIYPSHSYCEKIQLFNGHEVDNFLTENVEGWKGDPESSGTMMYFYEGEEDKSKSMRRLVIQALRDRAEQMKTLQEEISKYKY